MNLEARSAETTEHISHLFTQAAGNWIGCDWSTEFGAARLNLERLSSAQAILMARATSDKEEDAWWEASRWLARLEQEALEAEKEARLAMQSAQTYQWVSALTHARNACDIEARYHQHLVWKPLCDAIEEIFRTSTPH